MDTSKTYIKMCEKAEEIQTKPQPVHIMETLKVFVYDGDEVWFHYAVGTGKEMVIHKVWLPRQDQLQEIVEPSCNNQARMDLVYHIWRFLDSELNAIKYCHSMEQLWLAFVMKEKYTKVWDGERWEQLNSK